jgi:NAD(P)-dependent dehydrogenase (short-subunit alcohol dehydrogenase family)
MNISGKRVLITGGSSGIGLAIARILLAKGAKAVISGRRSDVLAASSADLKTASDDVWSIAADVGTAKGRATTLRRALEDLPTSLDPRARDRRPSRAPDSDRAADFFFTNSGWSVRW